VSPFQIVNQLVIFTKLGTNLMPLWATAVTFGQDRTAVGVFNTMFVQLQDQKSVSSARMARRTMDFDLGCTQDPLLPFG